MILKLRERQSCCNCEQCAKAEPKISSTSAWDRSTVCSWHCRTCLADRLQQDRLRRLCELPTAGSWAFAQAAWKRAERFSSRTLGEVFSGTSGALTSSWHGTPSTMSPRSLLKELKLDQCQYNLFCGRTGLRHRKSTGTLLSSFWMKIHLQRTCGGDHEHTPIEGHGSAKLQNSGQPLYARHSVWRL